MIRESGYSKCIKTEQPRRGKEKDDAKNLTVVAMDGRRCGQQQEEKEGELLHVVSRKSSVRSSEPGQSLHTVSLSPNLEEEEAKET